MLAGEGRLEEARKLLAKAVAEMPPDPRLWHNHALVLLDMGNHAKAEPLFYEILDRWPGFLPSYKPALKIIRTKMLSGHSPALVRQLSVVLNNEGNALQESGDHESAARAYREAISLDEGYANAWANLSNSLRMMGLVTEAESAARRAIAFHAGHAGAWNNLGCALIEQGRDAEGREALEEANRIDPACPEARNNIGSGRLFNLMFEQNLDDAGFLDAHVAWGRSLLPVPGRPRGRMDARSAPLRVGFLSADFQQHAMAMFVTPLLQHLDRSSFEVFCYAAMESQDRVTNLIRSLPLAWRQVHGMDDNQCAELIRNDQLDILIDLCGHTSGNRTAMLRHRPSPRIASWLGYMATTGHPCIDFRVTDSHTDPGPDSDEVHTERLIRLRGTQFAHRHTADYPAPGKLPVLDNGFVTFGSLNNVRKLSAGTIRTWARIMASVPRSRLLLQSKLFADPGTVGYFRGAFDLLGIEPGRVQMRGHVRYGAHMLSYNEIDIALDPFPYNGGATTCDAIWMGAPVVSLSGKRSVGRMGVSILGALGRREWIARTEDEYVAIATRLAADTKALAETRQSLRSEVARSPLADVAGFAADFGRAIREMMLFEPTESIHFRA